MSTTPSAGARRLAAAAALVLAPALTPAPAHAWDPTGHMVVALIAWRHMSPAARQAAVAALRAAPASTGIGALRPAPGSVANVDETFFVKAATWPDVIKTAGVPGSALSRPGWHYTDLYWRLDATQHPVPVTSMHPASENAAERLGVLVPSLGTTATVVSGAGALPQGVRLAWVLHLVGDLHQPLHCSSRVTTANPHGDVGGNQFPLGASSPRDLHAYWDDVLDTAMPRGAHEPPMAYVARIADRLEHDVPAPSATDAASIAYAQWVQAGLAIAERDVYGTPMNHAPSTAYRDHAFGVAKPAIVLAGRRLAATLDRALAPGSH